jgi:hypothetical protein
MCTDITSVKTVVKLAYLKVCDLVKYTDLKLSIWIESILYNLQFSLPIFCNCKSNPLFNLHFCCITPRIFYVAVKFRWSHCTSESKRKQFFRILNPFSEETWLDSIIYRPLERSHNQTTEKTKSTDNKCANS